jgi:hypothetical protein
VGEAGGRISDEAVIEEIEFHGAVGQIPRTEVQRILDRMDTALVRCEDVMFFRPVAQLVTPLSTDEPEPMEVPYELGALSPEPEVAVFDGLPLENHDLLRDRLIVDDPDGWAAEYPAASRQHGTAMASIVVHGQIGAAPDPLKTPVYVRPVLRPYPNPVSGVDQEAMPENLLAVDLVHRAVRRMFETEGPEEPAAPTVRVINFSIGDNVRLFDRSVSPLARLIDWLSWRYKVLFIISGGNHTDPIELETERAAFARLTPEQLQSQVLSAMLRTAHMRRLRTPAEAVNALTVASAHTDGSILGAIEPRINPYRTTGLPSPINPIGYGYRRSVKARHFGSRGPPTLSRTPW